MLTFISFATAFLAVARITRLFTEDRLLLGYRRWAVNKWGENSLAAYFVHCPWCTSIYVSTLVMPLTTWITLNHLHPPVSGWLTLLLAALAIPAASHVAGMLNKE